MYAIRVCPEQLDKNFEIYSCFSRRFDENYSRNVISAYLEKDII